MKLQRGPPLWTSQEFSEVTGEPALPHLELSRSGQEPAKAEPPAAGPELRFAWPTPSRVTVTERILKKGKRAVVRYDAALSARRGGGYELKLDKFQCDQVRAMLAQPGMEQAMKQKVGDFWNAWVGAWVGTDLAAGVERSATVPMQLPWGSVDSKVTMHHRGPDVIHKGAVRLEMETVLEGEPFRKAMVGMLSQMLQSAAPQEKTPDFETMLESARRVSSVDVVTDAATLRPYSARLVQVTQMQVAGKEREEREEREYTFAWPAQKAGKRR